MSGPDVSRWATTCAGYDDDTLVALAGAGPVRRAAKDVGAGKVAPTAADATHVTLLADGAEVVLDEGGPARARCSCPAPGTCKHVLAAVMWLRDRPAGEAPAADEVLVDPLAEVLALEPAALLKRAGAPAVRAAAAADDPGLRWEVSGGALVLHLTALGATCRWIAGAGFDGMVSDLPERQRRTLHLLALAALREEHGVPLTWPGAAGPGPRAAPAADHGPLLDGVRSTLRDLVAGGLSHLTGTSTERLLAHTVTARGAGLPRLAGQLRTVAGTLELLVRRDHQADVGDAIAVLGRTHALCDALERTATGTADRSVRRSLEGRPRRDFDEGSTVHLLPLGLHWWQTRGGAIGLTVSCWDVDDGRVLQTVVARPDGRDPSFTLRSAAHTTSLWPGSGPPSALLGSAWTLERPRSSEDGRLAPGGRTVAAATPMWRSDDRRLDGLGLDDWDAVSALLGARAGLAGATTDTLLLRPTATRAPVLDELAQVLRWEVQDAAGRWLLLGVPVTAATRHRMEQLERVAAATPRPTAVLVHVDQVDAATELVPVSVLRPGERGVLQVVPLDIASEPERGTRLSGRILRLLEGRRDAQRVATAGPASAVSLLLDPLRAVLETQAATGRPDLTERQVASLARAGRDLGSVGLATVAAATDRYRTTPDPAQLLRLAHLVTVTSTLDGLPTGPGR